LIEQHTIYPIPLAERHGTAGQLFTLWFGANLNVLTVVTGALATTIFHQSLLAGVSAIVLGNLTGTVFMALHAAQGPRLGVPQMVQSRGQFGAKGAGFVVALVAFMYLGYAGTAFVTGGQSLHFIAPALHPRAAIVGMALISLAAAIVGHDLIHFSTRMMTFVSGGALLLCYLWLLLITPLPHHFLTQGSFSAVGFFKMVSIGALWQLGYAPYVSDYSRYLPPDSGPRQAFWACYWGTALGGVLPMVLGAMIGPAVTDGNVITAIAHLVGPVSWWITLLLAPGVAVAGAICLYGGALAIITLGHTLAPRWRITPRARIALASGMFGLALLIGIAGAANFLALYSDFNELLLYLLIPWTAVNLIDYYLIRHGDYHVPSFFEADGGLYGQYNLTALGCYVLGILAQAPFIATDFYTGPLARALGGVDLSWLAGIAAVGPLYYFAVRSSRRAPLPERGSRERTT
jgi:NCS1 family nucleobase:cation symporter-1